jgi:methionyl-tRNA formyltransferase
MGRVGIAPLDTAQEVEDKLAAAAVPLVARSLPLLGRGALEFRQQDGSRATFCRRLAKADGVLDFSAPAAALAARINGLHPWPSVSVELSGVQVRLGLADSVGEAGGTPGAVVGTDSEGILVATGSGALRLRRLQRPGGRMLAAPEFLRGFPVPIGSLIASRPMPELVSATPFRR